MLYECYGNEESSKLDWKLGLFLALSAASTALSYYILRRGRQLADLPDMSKLNSLAAANRDSYFKTTKAPGPILLKTGEEVGYTRYFLRQLGCPPTDPMWFRRGKVEKADGFITEVRWSDGELGRVHCANLAKPGSLRWAE